jgi:hypothetical protein
MKLVSIDAFMCIIMVVFMGVRKDIICWLLVIDWGLV